MPRQPSFFRNLIVTVIVAIGIAVAWVVSWAWIGDVARSAFANNEPYEQIYLNRRGEPVIVRTSRRGRATQEILTLDGKPTKLLTQDLLYPQYIQPAARPGRLATATDWLSRLVAANDSGVPAVYWYLLHDGKTPGHAYGVGYHSQTRSIVGYFSRTGFSDSKPARENWFAIPGQSGVNGISTMHQQGMEPVYGAFSPRVLLLADNKLWRIDLARREIKALLDCPAAIRVGSVYRIRGDAPPPAPEDDLRQFSAIRSHGLVRQPESVLVVDPDSGQSTEFALPPAFRGQMFSAALLPDGKLLLSARRTHAGGSEQLAWIDQNGQVIEQRELPLKSWNSAPSLAAMSWQAALYLPLPMASAIYGTFGPLTLVEQGEAETYAAASQSLLAAAWPSMLIVLALSIAAAVLTYRRQKRFGLSHAGAWAAFVFLFGIPGWLAYRFHRAWPVLEECPRCHQPSPRDRTECLDCGAEFPPPPLKGTEVFA